MMEHWLVQYLDLIETIFEEPAGMEFLRERLREAFNMPGLYDGAMSEECKDVWRCQYGQLEALINDLQSRGSTDGE